MRTPLKINWHAFHKTPPEKVDLLAIVRVDEEVAISAALWDEQHWTLGAPKGSQVIMWARKPIMSDERIQEGLERTLPEQEVVMKLMEEMQNATV